MTLTIPKRIVLPALVGRVICVARIKQNARQVSRINYMACCSQKLNLCMAQYSDKTFVFQDSATVDYSSATEITFDIWESLNGAAVLSKSLTGGSVTLANNYSFQVDVSNVESGAMSATRKYCEAWVTLSGGDRHMVGSGVFAVIDTRKFG